MGAEPKNRPKTPANDAFESKLGVGLPYRPQNRARYYPKTSQVFDSLGAPPTGVARARTTLLDLNAHRSAQCNARGYME